MPDDSSLINEIQRAENVLRAKEGHQSFIMTDGVAGPETWAAIRARYAGLVKPEPPPVVQGFTSTRSERIIAGLHPKMQPYARTLWHQVNDHFKGTGITMDFVSGTRTWEEQQKLYEAYQNGGPKAAPPGHSFHQPGAAVDAGLFLNGIYIDDRPDLVPAARMEKLYAEYGAIVDLLGLEWGGTFNDPPHAELHPDWAEGMNDSQIMAEYRKRHESGQDFFTGQKSQEKAQSISEKAQGISEKAQSTREQAQAEALMPDASLPIASLPIAFVERPFIPRTEFPA